MDDDDKILHFIINAMVVGSISVWWKGVLSFRCSGKKTKRGVGSRHSNDNTFQNCCVSERVETVYNRFPQFILLYAGYNV